MAWSTLLVTGLLIASVHDDLRFAKVRNFWILAFSVSAITLQIYQYQTDGLINGLLGLSAGLIMTIPLYMMRALGGGDVKLVGVIGLATNWQTIGSVGLYSLFWGACLGLFIAVANGQLKNLFLSTLALSKTVHLSRLNSETLEKTNSGLHRLPYTVALFFGWLTFLSFAGRIYL